MPVNTLLYILVAAVISFMVAAYFYGYRSKLNLKLKWTFGVLRFLSIFLLLMLFINPKFQTQIYNTVKPLLYVAVDNSKSVNYLDKETSTQNIVSELKENSGLNEHFDVTYYTFGEEFKRLDSLDFRERQTNISQALLSINSLFRKENAATILITDGNQTLGSDYEFISNTYKQGIYPVILGDTLSYTDLLVPQINVNRYAYLKNDFPVEVFLVYNGTEPVSSDFTIRSGNTVVYRENVRFTRDNNSRVLNFTLPADAVGVQQYIAELEPLETEANKENNRKRFAVEVMDQATNVLIVSEMVHPDIGALKKSISSNEQRRVTLATPAEAVTMLEDFQLVILYQPASSFNSVMERMETLNMSSLTITGINTNWQFFNNAQTTLSKQPFAEEEVQGVLHTGYGVFAVEDIGFNRYPPVKSTLGDLEIHSPHEVLLHQQIQNIETGNILLATMEDGARRKAILDAEGIWKWRAHSYVQNNNFQAFDNFTGGLIQYLASRQRRTRLSVEAESFYYNSGDIKISAQYFDNNYIFSDNASLNISLTNKDTQVQTTIPLLLRNNFYEVNLSSLAVGDYEYTVSVLNENISSSGTFSIIDFNVEQQFLNANVDKLERVAENTGGKAYFISDYTSLIPELINDVRYAPVQKSEQKIVPLLDWKYLLFLLVILLGAEWFMRKYNGLI